MPLYHFCKSGPKTLMKGFNEGRLMKQSKMTLSSNPGGPRSEKWATTTEKPSYGGPKCKRRKN
ncbi:hypothetical protein LguiB_006060 [Lonicera macranthoides]